jgi:hypothetical protein
MMMMDIFKRELLVSSTSAYIYQLLYKRGFVQKVSQKRLVRPTASKEDNRKKFKKRVQKVLIVVLNDGNILIQCESCLYMICTKEENDG